MSSVVFLLDLILLLYWICSDFFVCAMFIGFVKCSARVLQSWKCNIFICTNTCVN